MFDLSSIRLRLVLGLVELLGRGILFQGDLVARKQASSESVRQRTLKRGILFLVVVGK